MIAHGREYHLTGEGIKMYTSDCSADGGHLMNPVSNQP